jgi:hypothetical protein
MRKRIISGPLRRIFLFFYLACTGAAKGFWMILTPLFEQKKVQIRVKYAGDKRKLHLLVKLSNEAVYAMPESVNLQIEAVLREYQDG